MTNLIENKKLVSDNYAFLFNREEKSNLYCISDPIILNKNNRVYIMVYKITKYHNFTNAIKRSIYEMYNFDIRVWKFNSIDKLWCPTKNGIRLDLDAFPNFLVTLQNLFRFFSNLKSK